MRPDVATRFYAHAPGSSRVELPFPFLAERLRDAEITGEHLAALAVWVSIGPAVAGLAWILVGGWYAIATGVVLMVSPVAFLVARAGRRTRHVARLLPDVVDMLGRSLRSGASLRGALTEAAGDAPEVLADELRTLVRALERGQSSTAALHAWTVRSPLPEVRVVAAALSLACNHEAGTTQALDGVSQSLRDRSELSAEIQSLTSQASASMQALVILPAGFLLIDVVTSQRVVRYLVEERLGQLCLIVGVSLNLLGWVWMRLLVRRQVPA